MLLQPHHKYKDKVFRMVFQEKKEFLELYNALNGTEYRDPEALTVTTLDSAIYLGMKNDVSYLLDDRLSLYEHQSTWNPNMPLRDLFYVSNIYSRLTVNENLFGPRLIEVPEPVFVVFYNGVERMPERVVLRLSDAFGRHRADAALELKVLVLNINPGYNPELMEKCRTLREYTIFVDKTRKYSRTMPLAQAMERAVEECIKEDVLADFLRKNRAEVLSVCIFEYDKEKHIRMERADARKQGWKDGKEDGEYLKLISMIQKKVKKGLSAQEIADILEEEPSVVEELYALITADPDAEEEAVYRVWKKKEDEEEEPFWFTP